jgi:glycosyltransferase involved in cell wall biosynthesis
MDRNQPSDIDLRRAEYRCAVERLERNNGSLVFWSYAPAIPPMSAALPVPLAYPAGDGAHRDAGSSPRAGQRVAVTVVIPTLDEATQIGQAVSDLTWADEVLVVDGGSADGTAALAEAAGARVIVVRGETIAAQRNAGIASARNAWILALDADERVSPQLRAELGQVVAGRNPTHAAYRMKFRNHYLGTELRHGPWGRDWHVRLFSRDRRYVCHRVHEHLEAIDDVGTLTGPIIHNPYRDLAHHVTKIVKYSRWGADDLHARGRRAGLWELTARPAWRFIRDYVVFSGWRDGAVGFVAAALSAFAAFLKYAFLFARSQSPNA